MRAEAKKLESEQSEQRAKLVDNCKKKKSIRTKIWTRCKPCIAYKKQKKKYMSCENEVLYRIEYHTAKSTITCLHILHNMM